MRWRNIKHTRRAAGLTAGVVLTCAVIWGISAVAYGATVTEVKLSPPVEVAPGTTFTVNINISQVVNFDAADYDLSFAPTVLRLDNITDGQIASTPILVDIWNQISPGRYRVVQNVPGLPGISPPGSSPVSGSGYLAKLHFSVIGTTGQSSNLNLTNGTLSNTSAHAIPANWVGGSIQVISVAPTGQGLPSAPSLPPETRTTEPPVTPTQPEAVTTEPEAVTTKPEVSTEKEELPPPLPPSPEAGTTGALEVAPTPAPSPPPAQAKPMNWAVVWGVIGGVAVVISLIIFSLVRRRSY